MKTDEYSIRRLVQFDFSANVAGGIGTWPATAIDPILGAALYEYHDAKSLICLYERGLKALSGVETSTWLYQDLLAITPLLLRELVRVRDPNDLVRIGITTSKCNTFITVPLKVYSALCPALMRIIKP